jgi:Heterokaryon incompatibility protein (HET)
MPAKVATRAVNWFRHHARKKQGPRPFRYTPIPSDPSEIPGEQEQLYSRLDDVMTEIRVLDVQPARDINADLVCKLRTISLHTPIWRYDALSYAWGDTATVENIIVNGIFKRVTSNLASALRHLRDTASVVTLWVDAISINQSDVAEREQQVRLMRKIYRNATATRAWLGPASTVNDLAFDFFLYLGTTPDAWEFDLPPFISSAPDHFVDFKEIFQRAWWSRVWILQEVTLASKGYIHCGRREIAVTDLVEAYRNLKKLGNNGLLLLHGEVNVNHLSDLVSTMGQCLVLLQQLRKSYATDIDDVQGFEFVRLLAECRENHATDARDKIFGLLGMAPRWASRVIEPDYRRPFEELYTQVALQLMQRADSCLLLSQATNVQKQRKGQACIPTWLPDWTQQGKRWIDVDLRLQQEKLFNACGRYQKLALSLVHLKGIAMRGLCVDLIINVSDKMPYHCEHIDAAACFSKWESFSLSGVSPPVSAESINGAFTEAYWKTVLNGAVPNSADETLLRLNDDDLKTFEAWRQQNKTVRGRQESFLLLNQRDRWNEYISSTTHSRRLFMCANGSLGIGPADTRAGDLLFVLAGGTQPYVLRAAKRKLDLYSVVGECYVDSIMDGQATVQPPAYLPSLLKQRKIERVLRYPALEFLRNCALIACILPMRPPDLSQFDAPESTIRLTEEDPPHTLEYEINDAGEKIEFFHMGTFAERVEQLNRKEHVYGDDAQGWRTIVLY